MGAYEQNIFSGSITYCSPLLFIKPSLTPEYRTTGVCGCGGLPRPSTAALNPRLLHDHADAPLPAVFPASIQGAHRAPASVLEGRNSADGSYIKLLLGLPAARSAPTPALPACAWAGRFPRVSLRDALPGELIAVIRCGDLERSELRCSSGCVLNDTRPSTGRARAS